MFNQAIHLTVTCGDKIVNRLASQRNVEQTCFTFFSNDFQPSHAISPTAARTFESCRTLSWRACLPTADSNHRINLSATMERMLAPSFAHSLAR